jgi:MiaB/RimO family radical SAM methylthiotransferase
MLHAPRRYQMRRPMRSMNEASRYFSARSSRISKVSTSLRDFLPSQASSVSSEAETLPPYLDPSELSGDGRSFYVETYGCQMNVSDTEVVHALLKDAGFAHSSTLEAADVVLLNTCAIREKAETTIWNRLREIRATRRKNPASPKVVGLLGCMGERLKDKLLETDRLVDVVCGPDAYRSLPRLLASARAGQPSLDVQLSLEETYADVAPVREGGDGVSAFVSIMRGCNNMCSYCIVPFTRGRERSRPASSIAKEVAALAAQGYKDVTLLGQNVNSYADGTEQEAVEGSPCADGTAALREPEPLRPGFKAKVPAPRASVRFADLVDQLAAAHPEMRFRFTSPHPKDFPDELLHVIRARPNVCQNLHIPAQSGSSAVLESMRRGYSREAYLELISRVRELLPRATLSSDFISGFCGETEEDHQQTLSLMREVRYDKAYMFAYSMREKTNAHRKLQDDVPEDVKQRRLREVIQTFNMGARESNDEEVGREHLVLIDGLSKKSELEWIGRTDTNKKVVFARAPMRAGPGAATHVEAGPGEYVAVRITESISANTLRGTALARCSIAEFESTKWASEC